MINSPKKLSKMNSENENSSKSPEKKLNYRREKTFNSVKVENFDSKLKEDKTEIFNMNNINIKNSNSNFVNSLRISGNQSINKNEEENEAAIISASVSGVAGNIYKNKKIFSMNNNNDNNDNNMNETIGLKRQRRNLSEKKRNSSKENNDNNNDNNNNNNDSENSLPIDEEKIKIEMDINNRIKNYNKNVNYSSFDEDRTLALEKLKTKKNKNFNESSNSYLFKDSMDNNNTSNYHRKFAVEQKIKELQIKLNSDFDNELRFSIQEKPKGESLNIELKPIEAGTSDSNYTLTQTEDEKSRKNSSLKKCNYYY